MERKIKGTVYGLILFLITLTGFAQMPIFKRYYIADIPGLGWLAQFYVTHSLHYIFAAAMIGIGVFVLLDLMLTGKGFFSVTKSGMVRGVLIMGLMVSGGFMVVRNLPGVYFSHVAIYVMNLSHLGLCMGLLMVSAYTLITGKKWIR